MSDSTDCSDGSVKRCLALSGGWLEVLSEESWDYNEGYAGTLEGHVH